MFHVDVVGGRASVEDAIHKKTPNKQSIGLLDIAVICSTEERYNNSGAREWGRGGEHEEEPAFTLKRNKHLDQFMQERVSLVQCNLLQTFLWKNDSVATNRLYLPIQSTKSTVFCSSVCIVSVV